MSVSSIAGGGSSSLYAAALAGSRSSGAGASVDKAAGSEEAAQESRRAGASGAASAADVELSESERQQVGALQERDREVRAHEMAHVAAGAGLVTRGASYTYQTGPDGQRYAIGGEVGIDTSPGRTPEESLAKAERVRAAALAPAEPSGQDRQVAVQAARMASEARMEIARQAFARSGTPQAPPAQAEDRSREVASAYSASGAPPPSVYVTA
ncbi:putative metalloprotease CJM1_0395 family protein [Thauera sp.]|jgi:hypothetical protein|uniref:putative metalloprotease CJM1_0395 family protein n=1 Tax=Thauera sp. TaxID=1905334 RepID=UPI00262FFBA0|nr:putative metalloprotease CJM1_0395 family protein [Thauera sp.]MCK6408945.1 hypothetical protein [Thauera sp.]